MLLFPAKTCFLIQRHGEQTDHLRNYFNVILFYVTIFFHSVSYALIKTWILSMSGNVRRIRFCHESRFNSLKSYSNMLVIQREEYVRQTINTR